ncbi:MAG: helix-turn-helix transcriptional regulator [Clostridia bacterium]|nr:helix-turn-helix transcriptional regulator [Clostridia bacterium]
MAFYEARAKRNGISLPIQCIHMKLNQCKGNVRHHYHDYTELLYGIDGCVSVYIGTRHYLLREGDMAIVHTHEPHDVKGTGVESNYIVVKFLPRVLLAGEQTYQEYSYALTLMENTHTKQEFFCKEELQSTDMRGLFSHLMKEWNEQAFGHELSLRADVTHIFLHILRAWQKKNPNFVNREDNGNAIMQKAVAYIGEHYADLTEESTASACGVSRSYFSRNFCHAMQTTFSSYVNSVRLREAERLLLTTDLSITEISEAVGFSTTSYFIDRFRSAHGITPFRYRTENRPEIPKE